MTKKLLSFGHKFCLFENDLPLCYYFAGKIWHVFNLIIQNDGTIMKQRKKFLAHLMKSTQENEALALLPILFDIKQTGVSHGKKIIIIFVCGFLSFIYTMENYSRSSSFFSRRHIN